MLEQRKYTEIYINMNKKKYIYKGNIFDNGNKYIYIKEIYEV